MQVMQILGTTNSTALGFVACHQSWRGARHRLWHGIVLVITMGTVLGTCHGIELGIVWLWVYVLAWCWAHYGITNKCNHMVMETWVI